MVHPRKSPPPHRLKRKAEASPKLLVNLNLFIADLHLDEQRPAIVDLFEQFLEDWSDRATALYVLGDLFEYWVGDDHRTALSKRVAQALRRFGQHGPSVYFMVGNRDFLVGQTFASQAGFELLQEPTVIHIEDEPTLLMHGDALCTDDHDYQAFRSRVRKRQWQEDFLALPIEERLDYARQARQESRQHTQAAHPAIMDVNNEAVASVMRRNRTMTLIHGHTHRPALHSLRIDGKVGRRLVVGDWYTQGSVLMHSADGYSLRPLRP